MTGQRETPAHGTAAPTRPPRTPPSLPSSHPSQPSPRVGRSPAEDGPAGPGSASGAGGDGEVVRASDATFRDLVLNADVPVLVKFTAAWCGPCRALTPVLAEIARERAGELRVVELDVDHDPGTQSAYGVLSTPTLMLFRGGEPVHSLVGARPKRRLLQELDAVR
ncbi:hypothetical protein E0L36_03115 [Streptomyces sp. AJS327]|nr:hypothetical protein [Streptomyces sp. AJS327]